MWMQAALDTLSLSCMHRASPTNLQRWCTPHILNTTNNTCTCRSLLWSLQQLLEQAPGSQVRPQDLADFTRLLWAAHLNAAASQARQAGMLELAARQLTALLRYVAIVPADRSVRASKAGSGAFITMEGVHVGILQCLCAPGGRLRHPRLKARKT